jgi:hypothetical protein
MFFYSEFKINPESLQAFTEGPGKDDPGALNVYKILLEFQHESIENFYGTSEPGSYRSHFVGWHCISQS